MRITKFVVVSTWAMAALSVAVLVSCQDRDKAKSGEVTFSDLHDEKAESGKISYLVSRREELSPHECAMIVQELLCISKQATSGVDFDCNPSQVTDEQKQVFVSAFREMPKILQDSLCKTSQIQIHEHLNLIGFASQVRAKDSASNQATSIIGFQSRLLLNKESQPDFLSWKEQIRYYTHKPDYETIFIRDNGPRINLKMKSSNPQLLLVLSHEASHVYDHLNKMTSLKKENCHSHNSELKISQCRYAEDSFPVLNWGEEMFLVKTDALIPTTGELLSMEYSNKNLKWAKQYPILASVCLRNCDSVASMEKMKDLYEEMKKSKFPTVYASYTPHEDFAESFSLHHLRREKILEQYQVIVGESDVQLDVVKQIEKDSYKKNRDLLSHTR